ncbi:MAG: imidazole glycerol phosphate synthase subunit HisH, partial [Anaerolineae bacterium]|nr:imidazole glycerol phosphate synthase subunit HisH [Anaerolineae bacterium]
GPKVPHIGWNQLQRRRDDPLLAGVDDGAYAYFVHSYYVDAGDPADVLATTGYGIDFASVVRRGSVYGIQPHPEKSQAVGQRILRNFLEIA